MEPSVVDQNSHDKKSTFRKVHAVIQEDNDQNTKEKKRSPVPLHIDRT